MSVTGFQAKIQSSVQSIPTFSILNPKILVLGEKTTAGSATSEVLVENITSKTDAKALFGVKSPLYQGINLMLSIIKPNGISRFTGDYKTSISAIPYSITGTAGVKKIALTGTNVNGSITLFVSSEYKYKITVETLATESKADIATKIVNAINTFSDIPVVASVSADDVLLTASVAGTWFNSCPVEILSNTSDLTLTLSQTVVGAGDLTLTNLLTTIATKKFDLIYIPKNLITNDIKEAIVNRINILDNKDYAGIVISTAVDTKANLLTLANSYKTDIGFAFIAQKTGYTIELPIESACRYMVQRLLKETQDTNNLTYVPSVESTNGRGTPSYKPTAMSDNILLYHPLLRNSFTNDELIELKDAGFIVMENNDNNSAVIYGCDLTTYSETLEGDAAIMRDVANWETLIGANAMFLDRGKTFVGKVITTGTPVPNTQQINLSNIASSFIALYDTLTDKDDVLGIAYGWFTNDPVARQEFIDTLNRTISLNRFSGTVSFDMINTIVSPLKQILMNAIYKK